MGSFAARQQRFIAGIFAAILFAALFWTGQTASASEAEWKGRIEAMPSAGLTGAWTVAGRDFVADSGTEFRQDKGAFAVGVCVEVEYVGASAPFTATKIAGKNADDCGGTSTPDPSPSPEPSETPDATPAPGGEREVYGVVESMPASGFIGRWQVNGVAYDAPAGAEFKQEEGPLVVGACVEIHYSGSAAPFTIREIETEDPSDCNGGTPSPDGTPTPSGEIEVYGRVDAMPANLVGAWTVDGVVYNATANTEFEQEDGAFAVNACVKIHADTGSPATIREIETERDYRCGGNSGDDNGDDDSDDDDSDDDDSDDDDNGRDGSGEAELYGVLQSFPQGLIGTWNVGGMSIQADAGTEFDQEHGPFAQGVTVKVHFSTDSAGVHRAREIETKFANDDRGDDDDGNGSVDGAEGHAYGTIDSIPAELVGTWQIGGVAYTATNRTRFSQEDGSFGVGVRVKVEYYLDADGARVAKKIETTSDQGGVTSPSHAVVFGFVRGMPAGGLMGEWTVDSASFVADAGTEFKENNGLLGIGAYVKVEYFVENGQNRIHEIETHVPPGAGPNSSMGVIDDNGGAIRAAGATATTWVIGGVRYTVLPATELNDQGGALTVGNSAVVNSYIAADGSRVATRIRGVTVNSRIFLPVVTR